MASGYKGKPVQVVITGDAKEAFQSLTDEVTDERARGITKSESQTLLNSIMKKIEILKSDPDYGVHIPRNQIPKEYLRVYDVNNLWKIDLSGAWRMIYTVRGSEIDIIALILDIMDHKSYSKKFGYRK